MIAVAIESMLVLYFAGDPHDEHDLKDINYWDARGSRIIVLVWICGYVYFILLGLHLRTRELIKLGLPYKSARKLRTFGGDDEINEKGSWVIKAGQKSKC